MRLRSAIGLMIGELIVSPASERPPKAKHSVRMVRLRKNRICQTEKESTSSLIVTSWQVNSR